MGTVISGPFAVGNLDLDTGFNVEPGDVISINCVGQIGVGYVFPSYRWVDGNGFNEPAGGGYPAVGLRRYSLVCRVAQAWYQGGTFATFTVTDAGNVVLACNDDNRADNDGLWWVWVTRTSPDVPVGDSPQLRVRGFEVVQVIQSANNAIPLVAGRSSVMRVYVEGATAGTDVGGTLAVSPSEGLPPTTGIAPMGTAKTLAPQAMIDRNRVDSSLNFPIPPVFAPSAALHVAVFVPGHENDPPNNGFTATASFLMSLDTNDHFEGQFLTPVLLDDERQALPRPTFAQYLISLQGSVTRYPIGDFGWAVLPPQEWNNPYDLTQQSEWEHLHLALQITHQAFLDESNLVTALVPRGAGYSAGGTGWPYQWPYPAVFVVSAALGPNDRWAQAAFAHEMGHTFGLNHAQCGGPANVDPRLPVVTEDPGWDVFVDHQLIPSGTAVLMGYCDFAKRWPSEVEYMSIYTAIRG
jgi:hypothetical protein